MSPAITTPTTDRENDSPSVIHEPPTESAEAVENEPKPEPPTEASKAPTEQPPAVCDQQGVADVTSQNVRKRTADSSNKTPSVPKKKVTKVKKGGLANMVKDLKTKAEEEELQNDPDFSGWLPPKGGLRYHPALRISVPIRYFFGLFLSK